VEKMDIVPPKTSDFNYHLPAELIAQTPIEPRDNSRLLLVDRQTNTMEHHRFYELPQFLKAGDILVFNNSRVIRARLRGTRIDTARQIEILLLRRLEPNTWETLIRSNKRVEAGLAIEMKANSKVKARVVELKEDGIRVVRFSDDSLLPQLGEVPLPPYIHEPLKDPERYQTVYSDKEGSVAAPTAGLHFTSDLLQKIREMGVNTLFVTLHVGINTFRPVREEDISLHPFYPEYGVVGQAVARQIDAAKKEGRRVICVGTTSVRLLESAAQASPPGVFQPFEGWANLFIRPGYQFKVVDTLITNFHLPKSTLLMLVSAFAGRDLVLRAYEEAIKERYRFYSFGDAMLII
jgi:S-adenosylmethionine:tRNA ribosyltransferase-isomerase